MHNMCLQGCAKLLHMDPCFVLFYFYFLSRKQGSFGGLWSIWNALSWNVWKNIFQNSRSLQHTSQSHKAWHWKVLGAISGATASVAGGRSLQKDQRPLTQTREQLCIHFWRKVSGATASIIGCCRLQKGTNIVCFHWSQIDFQIRSSCESYHDTKYVHMWCTPVENLVSMCILSYMLKIL